MPKFKNFHALQDGTYFYRDIDDYLWFVWQHEPTGWFCEVRNKRGQRREVSGLNSPAGAILFAYMAMQEVC